MKWLEPPPNSHDEMVHPPVWNNLPRPLQPLPECEGPKMDPFADDFEALDPHFIEVCGHGAHSLVFKTWVDGKVYAIKFFIHNFNEAGEWVDEARGYPEERQKLLFEHTIPFYNECRAFGRLKEVGLESLAVKTYGYVAMALDGGALHQQLDACLAEAGLWSCKSAHLAFDTKRGDTIMGLVKDWLEPDVAGLRTDSNGPKFLASVPYWPQQLDTIRELHRHGIAHRDVHAYQFVKDLLVDLSSAWTMPHALGPAGGQAEWWSFASLATYDFWRFQNDVINLLYKPREWRFRHSDMPLPDISTTLQAWFDPDCAVGPRPEAPVEGPHLPILSTFHQNWHPGLELCDPEVPQMKHLPLIDPGAFDWKHPERAKAINEARLATEPRLRRTARCGPGNAAACQPRPAPKFQAVSNYEPPENRWPDSSRDIFGAGGPAPKPLFPALKEFFAQLHKAKAPTPKTPDASGNKRKASEMAGEERATRVQPSRAVKRRVNYKE